MATKKQARKAPARKSVTRVAWLVIHKRTGDAEACYSGSNARKYAVSDWRDSPDDRARYNIVRVTYTLPRRTKP